MTAQELADACCRHAAHLRLQAIQLGQHLDGDRHGVLIEFEEGLGIVNQYVGVQDVSLFHGT